MIAENATRPILFFDGECNLCNSTVQFIIRHDRQKRFLFAPLQSTPGQQALHHVLQSGTGTVILYYQGRYYSRSAAALTVLRLLGGAWSLLYAFIVVPPFIRNAVYDLISRNRYKWFGKKDSCMIPTPEIMDRFITK